LSLTFTNMAKSSDVLSPVEQEQVSKALEHDAEIMSNSQLKGLLAGQSAAVQTEILHINTEARHKALQVALLIPLAAGAIGLGNSLRMVKLPDPKPSPAAEAAMLG